MEVYIHIPFCVRKCTYCDFLSGPSDHETIRAYIKTLLREIRTAPELRNEPVSSVYIGGGTPTILEGEDLALILAAVRETAQLDKGAEISVEANPGTLTRQKLAVLRQAGFNRLSIGLQSPDREELRLLGRIHSWEDFLAGFYMAREEGFANINVDLMSALPGQTREKWIRNLRQTAALSPEHISAYTLILEEGTPLAESNPVMPDEDTQADIYMDTAPILAEYGYEWYEISNYALPGRACDHNIGYWRRRDYLGIGLGAASKIRHCRFSNTSVLDTYLTWQGETAELHTDVTVLTREEEMAEYWFLGLRMRAGVALSGFEAAFGVGAWDVYGPVLEKHLSDGLLVCEGDIVRLSRRGIPICNYVMSDFV
ncbi:MAG: radical SAM family heme chaperone HemW [Blautia sp.]|nr:radical SAM family heme chaperone HemW [Blautia sp.]